MSLEDLRLNCPECGIHHDCWAAKRIVNIEKVEEHAADPLVSPQCPECHFDYNLSPIPLEDAF